MKAEPAYHIRVTSLLVALVGLLCGQAQAGYTHYWRWAQAPDAAALSNCIAEMKLIIQARKIILVGPDLPGAVAGSPKIEGMKVDINGIGDDAHEPFVFPGKVGFNFCKTEGKPYDEVVTACLILARDYFPDSVLAISSDGEWQDWSSGANLYSSVLRRRAKYAFGGNVLGQGDGDDGHNPSKSPAWVALVVVAAIALAFWLKRVIERS